MMECDFANNPCTSTPPSPSSPPSPALLPFSAPATPQRISGNECFSCRRKGHWAKECPNKTPKKSQPFSPGSNSTNGSGLPPIRCPCGRGTCQILTSKTEKNPERKFYRCPGDRSTVDGYCNFFKWCDELSDRAPMCPCGVGFCSLNLSRESTGPNGENWYFACRIKKNHGACSFFQWVDSEVNAMMRKYVGKSNGSNSAINDLDNKEFSSKIVPESPIVEGAENASNMPIIVIPSEQDEMHNWELVMQDVESEVPLQVFQRMRQSKSYFLKELARQISVAGNTITQDICPSLDDDVNTSENEGSFVLLGSDETDTPLSLTPGQDVQLVGGVIQEASGLNEPFGITQDEAKSILKEYGQALLNTLESMNPHRHGAMVKLAEATFKTLQNLSIECGPFGERVKEYIHNMSRLETIEGSLCKGLSSHELIKLLDSEKVQFDNVSRLHAEAVTAYSASSNHLQSLEEEISLVKAMLLQLEKQLSSCEAETLVLKTHVDEVSKEMLESKSSMEAAYDKLAEALELERQRDSVRGAAKVALETARVWLEQ
ncbi:uncharacterized protein LOC110650921 isoform X2 [Hevea brasiliensis]|uniref:uncharacterized protein LOC110650921 isoform X2 n=1 Tax=Hevea brasiliensis TaxID=3981 RepID=UPI0025FD3F44|nr:uncharacterized protein LOC110650921 isoform X2 [Hevea brasiliensis]